jgi:hypothetical protein
LRTSTAGGGRSVICWSSGMAEEHRARVGVTIAKGALDR